MKSVSPDQQRRLFVFWWLLKTQYCTIWICSSSHNGKSMESLILHLAHRDSIDIPNEVKGIFPPNSTSFIKLHCIIWSLCNFFNRLWIHENVQRGSRCSQTSIRCLVSRCMVASFFYKKRPVLVLRHNVTLKMLYLLNKRTHSQADNPFQTDLSVAPAAGPFLQR